MRTIPPAVVVAFMLGAALGFAGACGPGTSPQCSGACSCTNNDCTCTSGGACTLGPVGSDGGVDPDAGDLPSNITFDCSKNNTCTVNCGSNCTSNCANTTTCTGSCGSGCTTQCEARSTCTQTIGDNSTAQCEGTSTCSLITGADASVSCGGGSTCNVTLQPSSTLDCIGTSVCNVSCADGGCKVNCEGDSTCTCANAGCTLICFVGADAGAAGSRAPITCNGVLTCSRSGRCP